MNALLIFSNCQKIGGIRIETSGFGLFPAWKVMGGTPIRSSYQNQCAESPNHEEKNALSKNILGNRLTIICGI